MSGYLGMPDKTVEAWRNLWFHTGDRGYRDADGHFYFVDRLKDSIRRRGENVSSFEVEQVVNGHAAVLESAAYAVPAEVGEDEVMVSIVPRPGETIEPSALVAWCEARLPRFAVPRFVDIVTELPKTPVGRVEKFKLRSRGVTTSTWDRERPERTEPGSDRRDGAGSAL
jgi:crotonobetaine/carnitine-CoA ligase